MDFFCTLMDHAVLQRTAQNVSDHPFSGKTSLTGELRLTVRQGKNILPDFRRLPVGKAAKGKFRGVIKGIPAGGPYTLEFRIGSKKVLFRNIMVGDLWLLAGQSNMADSGCLPSLAGTSEMVRGFYMDNHWDIARDPLHDVRHAAAPVHGGNPANPVEKRLRGAGPGVPFGIEMYRKTGIPQGLIACAHGGTSLAQWDPELKVQGNNSLYGALCERVRMLGGRVAGILWYQGEDDIVSDEKAVNYAGSTAKLFAALRRDCRNRQLPIVFAQLGTFIALESERPFSRRLLTVRDAQYRMGQHMPHTACVPVIDLEVCDTVHLSTRSVVTLGKRMADAMEYLTCGGIPQIALKSVRCRSDHSVAQIKIEFKNVQGKLRSSGIPGGFSLVDMAGNFVAQAVSTVLQGSSVTVQTRMPYCKFQENYRIAYGGEHHPHANITDEAGRSLPCFVQELPPSRIPSTDMLDCALVSEAVYGDDLLAALKLPENLSDLNFSKAKFSNFYLPCPRESSPNNALPKIYCYKFRMETGEKMKLRLLFGADAPFALYYRQTLIMRHYTANPVQMDEFSLPLTLEAGIHDFVCVFSSNSGNGWGICCRVERTDGKTLPRFTVPE
ncbi:MAG: sialate O-acetylesterase [Lentisphaerae bacterium]|nr:sialate O-acetylesterase [Lentisphaerota bacterium]